MRSAQILAGLLVATLLAPVPATAQEEVSTGDNLVRVFVDCSGHVPGCDREYIRTEITFIDYVRDRTAADVHLLITVQSTGAGGSSYTLNFIGRNRFEGVSDTLTFITPVDATDDIRRSGLTRTIKLGLVRFAASTNVASRLDVKLDPLPEGNEGAPRSPARDPWKAWVFGISTNGFMNGESSYSNLYLGVELSANRTTNLWKFGFGIDGNFEEGAFEIDDTTTERTLNRSYDVSISLVKSIGPNVSAGMEANIATSTFGNQELVTRFAPAIEYNIFPYSESTRRQLTFAYSVGANSYDYRDITIFGRTSETLGSHALIASYSTRQPWGSSSITINGSQFLHDMSKYRVALSGNMNVRLFRGFSINGGGSYSRIRDQISLEAGTATPEEILLRQRQLATGYRYFFHFGVGYNFGSLFNPVVNPRMRSVLGGVEFF